MRAVQFLRHWQQYMAGDVAGFPEAQAESLIAQGVAGPFPASVPEPGAVTEPDPASVPEPEAVAEPDPAPKARK